MATYNFFVTFDATAVDPLKKVSVSPIHGFIVEAETINLITFTLQGPPDAMFPSTPIQWQDGHGVPVDLPPWFVMHRYGNLNFSLWDFNSAPTNTTHNFQVSVVYQGDVFTSHDPAIVNEPPIQS
jgi:hypothetical protein